MFHLRKKSILKGEELDEQAEEINTSAAYISAIETSASKVSLTSNSKQNQYASPIKSTLILS